jgi:hypothetical protein
MRPHSLLRRVCLLIVCALAVMPRVVHADEVTDWNAVLIRAIQTAGPLQGRVAAIVHVAMFDAYNGVERPTAWGRQVAEDVCSGAARMDSIRLRPPTREARTWGNGDRRLGRRREAVSLRD